MFDFLRDIVSRVPDYGHGHSDAASEDRALPKRRLERLRYSPLLSGSSILYSLHMDDMQGTDNSYTWWYYRFQKGYTK